LTFFNLQKKNSSPPSPTRQAPRRRCFSFIVTFIAFVFVVVVVF